VSRPPIALVTGAARRVGRAIALELARAGFDLHLTANTRGHDLDDTIRAAREASGRESFTATSHRLDFLEPDATEQWARRLASELPVLDALVHNASSYDRADFGSIQAADVVRHFRINALAPLLITQSLAPSLRRSSLPHGGAVVILSDTQVHARPHRGFIAYGMSKAAVDHLVACLAVELAPQVRVNGVAPGVVAWPEGTPRSEIEAYEKRIPLGRSGEPEDAAKLVRTLVVDTPYLTGEVIRLDGGRWLR
jgi:pteridine reductase